MGKGKGKKNRRGGRPNRGTTLAKGPAVADQRAAAAPDAEASKRAPASNAFRSEANAAEDPFLEMADAGTSWQTMLRAIGMRVAIYALFVLGAYCVIVALFSPWGFNVWDTSGVSVVGGLFWIASGGALLYGGWYLSSPDVAADAKDGRKAERPRSKR